MAKSAYHTQGISIFIHKIVEPNLRESSHTLKSTFDFAETTEKYLEIGSVLGVADIKSLYTNISYNLGLKPLTYWTEKLQHKIEHLQRFTKTLIRKGMSIILKYNYFDINGSFIHQIKGTAMVTYAVVVHGSHRLPEIFSYDTGELFSEELLQIDR